MHILILATGTPSKHLTDALTERKHTFEVYDPRDLAINISEQSGYDRIYNANESLKAPTRLKANGFDAVISRIGADTMHSASILRHLNENLGIFCPQSASGILMASDKLWSYQVLSQKRVKTINTYFTRRANHVRYFVEQLGGLPIVGKTPTGSKGKGVFILDSIVSANSVLGLLHSQDVPVMLQRFVKTATHAVNYKAATSQGKRLIVVGDKVVCTMLKTSFDQDDFRDNLDRGATAESITASSLETELAINATKALGLQFAGVDLVTDSTLENGKNTFVVEVNSNPGTGIISVTNHNYFTDLIELIEQKADSKGNSASDTEETEAENQNDRLSIIQQKLNNGKTLSPNEYAIYTFAQIKRIITN